jgi:hypothetical protein
LRYSAMRSSAYPLAVQRAQKPDDRVSGKIDLKPLTHGLKSGCLIQQCLRK